MNKHIDLSHSINDQTITYKGLPAPVICDYLSREASKSNYTSGTSFQIGKIEMVSNTGTYLDCPFHRYENGEDLSQIQLTQMANLTGLKVQIPEGVKAISSEYFANLELKGKALLVQTGWDRNWATDQYFEDHPYLTESAALFLRGSGVLLVGIDSHNIDNTTGQDRPVHSILLDQKILIVEHLTMLSKIGNAAFTFTAVPPKIEGMGTFPVRAYATLQQ